jgi:hypothetical protein
VCSAISANPLKSRSPLRVRRVPNADTLLEDHVLLPPCPDDRARDHAAVAIKRMIRPLPRPPDPDERLDILKNVYISARAPIRRARAAAAADAHTVSHGDSSAAARWLLSAGLYTPF